MNIKIFRVLLIMLFALLSMYGLHYYWAQGFIKRYDPDLFFIVVNVAIVSIFVLSRNISSEWKIGKLLFYGVMLGYVVGLVSTLLLELLFYPFMINNYVSAFETNLIQTVSLVFAYPIVLGGWLYGAVWGLILYLLRCKM